VVQTGLGGVGHPVYFFRARQLARGQGATEKELPGRDLGAWTPQWHGDT
jgi:hypothetical protein